MNKSTLKETLIKVCIDHQKNIAYNAKQAMDDVQQQANEYGLSRDKYDCFRAQLLRKRDLFAKQYQKTLNEADILQKINPQEIVKKVQFGAVVITNKQKLFIAIGIGKVTCNDDSYYVISPKVPIYHALEDKQKGDEINFNGSKIIIEEIL